METIIYQGQPIEAKLVNYLSGTIPTSTVDADGDEELFRDAAGRYYLRRTLNLLADYHEDGGEGNIPASGRTRVHRLNVNAAILWATTRLNSETLDLRIDAAALLMENRGYTDPHPIHLNGVRQKAAAAAALPLVAQNRRWTAADGEHFAFTYLPSERREGFEKEIILRDDQMQQAQGLAAVFALPVEEFLRALLVHKLPGQPYGGHDDNLLGRVMKEEHVAFACFDDAMRQRIERAAQAAGESADEFLARSIGSDVDCYEETMLVHPQTGDLLMDSHLELYQGPIHRLLAPPTGQEEGDRPFWLRAKADAQPPEPAAGLSVQVLDPESQEPICTVELDGEDAAFIQEYARAQGLDFADAFNKVAAAGMKLWQEQRHQTGETEAR